MDRHDKPNTAKLAWSAIILFWIGMHLGYLLGWVDVSIDTLSSGLHLIILGLIVHIVYTNREALFHA